MISGSLEDLLVRWWSLVGGLWVDGGPAGESVVGGRWVVEALVGGSVVLCQWRTCWWVGGLFSMVGGLLMVTGFVIRRTASTYFSYFRAIPVQRYRAWSQSRHLILMSLL